MLSNDYPVAAPLAPPQTSPEARAAGFTFLGEEPPADDIRCRGCDASIDRTETGLCDDCVRKGRK